MFIDELEIYTQAGNGGNGALSFRREKYVEFGGPDGGDGGRGGNVVLRVRPDFNTLMPLRNRKHYHAGPGANGAGSNCSGAFGEDLYLEVPVGTLVRDRESGTLLADLTRPGEEMIIARGGRGGKGNKHFTTSTHQAPRFAQSGEEGESLWLRLELKIMADIGLVGFPNAGKSTLISRISAARPKVADYPFTTLEPNLGVVKVTTDQHFVIADIPGIIEGAHLGAGLGLRFLRHIERTALLLLIIDVHDGERSASETYRILRHELISFGQHLQNKRFAVAFTKSDLGDSADEALSELRESLTRESVPWFIISAVSGDGIRDMVFALHAMVLEEKSKQTPWPLGEDETASDLDAHPVAVGRTDPLDEV